MERSGNEIKSTTVRGAKRSLIRLKAAKIKEDQETKELNEQRNSNRVYEDMMVFVKDQKIATSKPRGRPRKSVSKQTLSPSISKHNPSSLEVICMPSVRGPVQNLYWRPPISLSQQHPYVIQGPKSSNAYRQTLLRSNISPQSVLEPIYPQRLFKQRTYPQSVLGPRSHSVANSFTQSILGLNSRPQTLRTVLELPVTVTKYSRTNQKEQIEKSYVSEDLKELLETIEQIPESPVNRDHDVEKLMLWLKTPLSFKPSTLPPSVSRIHQQIEEWDETEDKKLQQISKWLLEDLERAVLTVASPKVVVESQPNASECGVWASIERAL